MTKQNRSSLRVTDAGRRRLEEFEKRTNQQTAIEIQRDENHLSMDAPTAQREIVGDGQAAASSAAAPPPFSDLPSHAEPKTVSAAGNHHRPRGSRGSPEPAEQLGQEEEVRHDVHGAMSPEGEPAVYSQTSPGRSEGSPGASIFDDESMADVVDDEESDLRDIFMFYQVEDLRRTVLAVMFVPPRSQLPMKFVPHCRAAALVWT